MSGTVKPHSNQTSVTGAIHEDQYTSLTIFSFSSS